MNRFLRLFTNNVITLHPESARTAKSKNRQQKELHGSLFLKIS